jgi:hypothetical protein
MSSDNNHIQIFNAYYIEFLKTIKSLSKAQKGKSPANKICIAIKKSYSSMDTLSPSYLEHLVKTGIWDIYESLENKENFTDEFKAIEVYKGITIKNINAVTNDEYFSNHLVATLNIFRQKLDQPDMVLAIVNLLSKQDEFSKKLEEITDETVKEKLKFLNVLHIAHKKNEFDDKLKDIESTSLGKLAKEIMGDLNIDEIQKSMNDPSGNIFESFSNPNSGLGKVLSSVSQKMLLKLGSGELNKDTLLTDAMNLAGKLPGIMPDGMSSQLGNIGEMLSQLQKMGGGGGGNQNPMDMMQEMMKGMNLNKTQKHKATSRMNSTINKTKLESRLKKKLQKRKENNIQKEVEEDE